MKMLNYLCFLLSGLALSASAIERITVDPSGVGQGGFLGDPLISADGNTIVFWCSDPTFVDTDYGYWHTYAYDRLTDTFERLSNNTDGFSALGNSFPADISDDGRFVIFESEDELDPDDDNPDRDVYLRDRDSDETIWVSFTHDGGDANASCYAKAVSNDGRYVVFTSAATNLVSPSTAPGQDHVYLRDRNTGELSIISQSTNGTLANNDCFQAKISGDGRYVVFSSSASNLLDGGLDTNGKQDIFIRDLQATPSPTTTRVSLTDTDAQISDHSYDPDISSDGMMISFKSDDANIVTGVNPTVAYQFQIYVRDRNSDITKHVSRSTGGTIAELRCDNPTISPNGRYVVFSSVSDAIAPGTSGDQSDTFAHDLQTGITSRVSVGENGELGNGGSIEGVAANDGTVLFKSSASNFVLDDDEGSSDLFVAPADAPVAYIPPSAGGASGDPNAALRASLLNKLNKLKKKGKKAKGTPKAAKFKKKAKALKKKLKALG